MKKRNVVLTLAVILSIIGAVVIGLAVSALHGYFATNAQLENSHNKLSLIYDMIQQSKADEVTITDVYDSQYESKAKTVAFMANNIDGFEYTDSHIDEIRSLINVDLLQIKDASGNVIASAGKTPGEETEPRTYTAEIGNGNTVSIVENSEKLQNNLDANASLSYVLDGIHVGQNGFAFALHAEKKTILYYPDESLIGDNAADHGIDMSTISDGNDMDITIDGTTYFCSVKQIDKGLIICAVPRSEIDANRTLTIIVSVFVYALFASVIIIYAFFLRVDHRAKVNADENKALQHGGRIEYNKALGKKFMAIIVCGAIATFALTFYAQTLFSLSQQSITNNSRGTELRQTLSENDATIAEQMSEYNDEYLEKARCAAYIIERTDSTKLTQDFMKSLKSALDADSLEYFDTEGKIIASDSDLWSFTLSKDENDQSYEFWDVLGGSKSEMIQDPTQNDSGVYMQYVAEAILDDNHKTIGMIDMGVSSEALGNALINTDFANVISGIQIGKNGFAFAVNTDDDTFVYFPNESLIGKNVLNYGMNETQLVGDYNDFITINGNSYYCASGQYGNYILYIAVPSDAINTTAFPVAAATTIIMLAFMLLLRFVLCLDNEKIEETNDAVKSDEKVESQTLDVDLGDGRKAKATSILARWTHRGLKWENKSSGQKTGYIFNFILTIAAFVIMVMVLFADKIFADNSLFRYILKGQWQRGINIFSVTFCILTAICIIEITIIVRKLIMWLAQSLNARGETVCRLIDNFLKFAAIIGLLYYCLGTLGVDTATLVASAGILSLVVGLGANSLISDILAGLFIVFEGEFQVGDIVTIDGFRGTVVEIGIRTVKIKEGGGNIKVISNRNVSNVLNMTKDFSYVAIDMGIEYGEDLRYVEKILEREFPVIKDKLPAIVEGPFYRGISELADSSVNIKIIAKCTEADRIQLDRDLRRELKLVFDKNKINIPFPQIVMNQPTEIHHKTSEYQNRKADEFVKDQAEKFSETDIKEN